MTFPWSPVPSAASGSQTAAAPRLGQRQVLHLGEEGEPHSFQESHEDVNAQKIQEQMFLVQLGKEDGCSWPKQVLRVCWRTASTRCRCL